MTFLSPLYQRLVASIGRKVPSQLQPLWQSPAGPQTIFFWAPACKWVMVVAGLADVVYMPVEKVSPFQTFSIASSALIWSRWSMIITPKNWTLFSVNSFVGVQQSIQLARVYRYNYQQGRLRSVGDVYKVLVS